MEKGNEEGKQSREIKILKPESMGFLRNPRITSVAGV